MTTKLWIGKLNITENFTPCFLNVCLEVYLVDSNTKGGLTHSLEFLAVIPCAPKDFKH